MAKSRVVSRRVTATLAIVFLIPAMVFFLLWTSVSLKATGISEQVKTAYFMEFFPKWLQDMNLIHIIALSCCVITVLLAARSITKRLLAIRVLMLISILVALSLIVFNLVQII